MLLIKEIFKIIDILTVAYLIYYVITGFFILKTKRKINETSEKHKFAIIIPARNEEKVIGNLLQSLNKQNYPKELYDIYVVINNCTDNTKKIALENKANIIECKMPIASKGAALRTAFAKLNSLEHEAYIIFDADNITHPDFLKNMNNALAEGYKLAQGFRDSKNPSDTWISGSYSLHYLIHNVFLNKSRMNIEKSSFINGTGFMITKEALIKNGYKAHTLTEDIEMTVRCAISDEKIAFVEDAITYDEQPTTFTESWKQRKRWSIGTVQCCKIYFTKLLHYGIKNASFSCLDGLIFLISPLIQSLGLTSYIVHAIIAIVNGININIASKIITLICWYLVSLCISISAIKFSKKSIKPYLKGIFALPLFVLSWMPINFIAFFIRKNRWEKIEHTKDITIDKMLEVDYK